MTISAGERLPDVTFHGYADDAPTTLSTADIFDGRRVVLIGVPGAFTKTCSNAHLPEFIAAHDAIIAAGIDRIVCVAVNDAYVMNAWGKALGGDDKIWFVGDPHCEFTNAIGVATASTDVLGVRCRRFALVADNGVVTQMNLEPVPGLDVSRAGVILAALTA